MPRELELLLREIVDRELPHLRELSAERAAIAPKPGAWSPQEELGHLIDSAVNNHMRIVLASIDGEYCGRGYAQDAWVAAHGYLDFPWRDLVETWSRCNSLLAHVAGRIPESAMQNRCVVDSDRMTLRFLIEDYVIHMHHHLDHILGRAEVTRYPPATLPRPSVSR